MPELGYKREGDVVTLTMTADDYGNLLLALGIATGSMSHGHPFVWVLLKLANRLNAGNPDFKPYAVPGETSDQGGRLPAAGGRDSES